MEVTKILIQGLNILLYSIAVSNLLFAFANIDVTVRKRNNVYQRIVCCFPILHNHFVGSTNNCSADV